MVSLFISHFRPIIELCSWVLNVWYLDVRRLESLQRRWTREVAVVWLLDYGVRLRELGFHSVGGRLLRSDLIKIWKVLHCGENFQLAEIFQVSQISWTWGHSPKLFPILVDLRFVLRRSLAVRSVFLWNSLPTLMVETDYLTVFKVVWASSWVVGCLRWCNVQWLSLIYIYIYHLFFSLYICFC